MYGRDKENAYYYHDMNKFSSLSSEPTQLRKEVNNRFDIVEEQRKQDKRELNDRQDNFRKHLACVDDDTPTREEHDKLEKRVTKLEKKVAIN